MSADGRGDLVGVDAPGVLDVAGHDHGVGQREEGGELAGQVLVAGGAEDQGPPGRREVAPEGVGQRLGRGDVVGAVDDQPGALAQDLDPRRPGQLGEPPGHGVGVDGGDAQLAQGVEAGQGDGGVLPLVLAQERQGDRAPVARPGPDRDRRRGSAGRAAGRGVVVEPEVGVELEPAGPSGLDGPGDRRDGLVPPDAADDGPPRLMIPAFSRAIAPRVVPSWRVWSSEIDVRTDSRGRTTLVESSRPPIPTSRTTAPTSWRAKWSRPIAVVTSKKVAPRRL